MNGEFESVRWLAYFQRERTRIRVKALLRKRGMGRYICIRVICNFKVIALTTPFDHALYPKHASLLNSRTFYIHILCSVFFSWILIFL